MEEKNVVPRVTHNQNTKFQLRHVARQMSSQANRRERMEKLNHMVGMGCKWWEYANAEFMMQTNSEACFIHMYIYEDHNFYFIFIFSVLCVCVLYYFYLLVG